MRLLEVFVVKKIRLVLQNYTNFTGANFQKISLGVIRNHFRWMYQGGNKGSFCFAISINLLVTNRNCQG